MDYDTNSSSAGQSVVGMLTRLFLKQGEQVAEQVVLKGRLTEEQMVDSVCETLNGMRLVVN